MRERPEPIRQLITHSLYGTSAGTFLSNAGVLQAFGVNDYDTADMLSKTMGRETITYETSEQSEKDVMVKDPERSLSKTQHLAARNLMDANEIMKLAADQAAVEPVYEEMAGWSGTTAGARSWADLPAQAIKYIQRVQELIETPVALVSTSPEREDTILIRDPFVD